MAATTRNFLARGRIRGPDHDHDQRGGTGGRRRTFTLNFTAAGLECAVPKISPIARRWPASSFAPSTRATTTRKITCCIRGAPAYRAALRSCAFPAHRGRAQNRNDDAPAISDRRLMTARAQARGSKRSAPLGRAPYKKVRSGIKLFGRNLLSSPLPARGTRTRPRGGPWTPGGDAGTLGRT